jgi:hypothetical protein
VKNPRFLELDKVTNSHGDELEEMEQKDLNLSGRDFPPTAA